MQVKIENLVTPVIHDLGYVLWGCEYLPQGRHGLLRIYIDQEAGITLSDCEMVSKAVSANLDVENLIKEHYTLEISSPGMPRPIFYWHQYSKYLGQELRFKLYQAVAGTKNFIGTLQAVNADILLLQRDGIDYCLSSEQIVKAYVVVHF